MIHEYQTQLATCMVHSRPAMRTISKQTPTQPLPGLDESDNDLRSQEDRWGHQLGKKQPDTICIVLQNVDGIPNNTKGSIKLDCLHTFMMELEINILALTELNKAWD